MTEGPSFRSGHNPIRIILPSIMATDSAAYIVYNFRDRVHLERVLRILEEKLDLVPAFIEGDALNEEEIWHSATASIERSRLVLLLVTDSFGADALDRRQYDYALGKNRLTIPVTTGHHLSADWQVFEFASQDCIDLLDSVQMEKFTRNMKSWLETDSSFSGKGEDFPCVDMGLSVKWAKYNLGSRFEDLPGSYFAWGETKPRQWYGDKKQEYIWNAKSDGYSLTAEAGEITVEMKRIHTKYSSGELDSMERVDDAASVILKGKWRIPTREEVQELLDNCTIQWIDSPPGVPDGNGEGFVRSGYLFTSKINGNTLFFPLTGFQENVSEECYLNQSGEVGAYWTSDLKGQSAYALMLFPEKAKLRLFYEKDLGFNIRPVRI